MIAGIGTDIVDIEDMATLYANDRFIRRVFSEEEIVYCENKQLKYQHYAARFAAKEATMKALGCGWDQGVQWKHIEVIRDSTGPPVIRLHEKAKEMAENKGIRRIHLSLSHSEGCALAFVILEL
jgi:holo-[acyl-carrier protein] synthase